MDKRGRLVEAAAKLAYEQGFNRTTLADIASEADVPLGNVYYYFKTKEAIGEALVERRLVEHRGLRERWDRHSEPKDRLAAFVQMTLDRRRELTRSGCPIGSLCTELQKQGGPVAERASRLFAELLAWLEQQFRALGRGEESPELAVHLLSTLEGATLLTHSLGTPRCIEREAHRAMEWIRTL